MVEVRGLLSASPPSTNLIKSMGALLCLRAKTENYLNWLQGAGAARLPAERSRKWGGGKRENEANWKVKKVNVKGRGATYEMEVEEERSVCACANEQLRV